MKKIVKYFSLVVLTTLIFVLTGCGLFGPSMPKPVGKKVQMSVTQLENKIDKLSFNEIDKGYVTVDSQIKTEMEYEGETEKIDQSQALTVNLSNNDTWLEYKSKIKENAGQFEVTLKAFESSKNTYFDVKTKNNQLFDDEDDNDRDLMAGKYRMDNSGFGSNLTSLLSMVGGYIQSPSSIYYNFDAYAYTQLLKYDFKGLTLYESPTHFSIKLAFSKKDIETERDEIADILRDIAGVPGDDEDAIIEKLKHETVFVFERNKMVAAGMKVEMKVYDEGDLYNVKGMVVVKYNAKQPKAVKYNDYRKIDSLQDIVR